MKIQTGLFATSVLFLAGCCTLPKCRCEGTQQDRTFPDYEMTNKEDDAGRILRFPPRKTPRQVFLSVKVEKDGTASKEATARIRLQSGGIMSDEYGNAIDLMVDQERNRTNALSFIVPPQTRWEVEFIGRPQQNDMTARVSVSVWE